MVESSHSWPKIVNNGKPSIVAHVKFSINPDDAETGIFYDHMINTMTADVLAFWVARPSTRMVLSMQWKWALVFSVQWHHNGRDGVSNHQPHDCLHNRSFRRRSKKTSKPRVTGLCAGNSPVTGGFPAQMASNAENVSIWWRDHDKERLQPHT